MRQIWIFCIREMFLMHLLHMQIVLLFISRGWQTGVLARIRLDADSLSRGVVEEGVAITAGIALSRSMGTRMIFVARTVRDVTSFFMVTPEAIWRTLRAIRDLICMES